MIEHSDMEHSGPKHSDMEYSHLMHFSMEHSDRGELDVIPPLRSFTITLNVSPADLELAVATSGASLCGAMMQAIVAAMVVDTAWTSLRP
ncbi:MAG: hypothetical protein MUO37_15080 [Methyloceanibacter sp.]|jgi:hypothetical protein|nr:hypothetical protein [Methyloceanibacter sp.]